MQERFSHIAVPHCCCYWDTGLSLAACCRRYHCQNCQDANIDFLTGSRRRPSQPQPRCGGPQAQDEGKFSSYPMSLHSGTFRTTSPLATYHFATTNKLTTRLSCPPPAPSSWTSSAPAASPSPPSSHTPRPSSSAPAALRFSASPPVARPVSQRAALSGESRRIARTFLDSVMIP